MMHSLQWSSGKLEIWTSKEILEVPTQLFVIWRKNMTRGQSDYLSKYITFIYGKEA